MRMLFINLDFKWYHIILLVLWMVIANIVAIPHWIMGRPRWYAIFLDRTFGQGWNNWDIYK
jgi:hypothetical protein